MLYNVKNKFLKQQNICKWQKLLVSQSLCKQKI